MPERRIYRRDLISEALAKSIEKRLETLARLELGPAEHKVQIGDHRYSVGRVTPNYEDKSASELNISQARALRIPCPFTNQIAELNAIAGSMEIVGKAEWRTGDWIFDRVREEYHVIGRRSNFFDVYLVEPSFYQEYEGLRQRCISECIKTLKELRTKKTEEGWGDRHEPEGQQQ